MFGHLPPVQTPIDNEYDYEAEPTPTTASAAGLEQNVAYGQPPTQFLSSPASTDGAEEALMDLAQLEEVHEEAERMKLLGNKHMANQEYSEAFDAYSSALQLSPVGPNSHVFLSNRAAALLSLKQYEAAATDARRAIALAPTFGKAHARLGQAMYFLKRYGEAVAAYQDAVEFEPENQITRTYLEKAMVKLNRDSKSRASSDWESVAFQDSVATDPNRMHSLVAQPYNRGSSTERAAMLAATAKVAHDPEFDEAVRIQKRANSYLVQKKYKDAIAEYTAALFLVPYDPVLSPDLHLGRAHALNGSRRHESARKDAMMAIKLSPSPAAYSTLAKTQFYLKNYQGSIDAFRSCQELLPDGEQLGTFDLAYLEKAERAVSDDVSAAPSKADSALTKRTIPKLPPPRFVPREQAIANSNALPSLPKHWPQQLPTLQCGPERPVTCLGESLGIKLNRGSDGIVRVLTVSPESAALRNGDIYPGDVVREAAGVDLRRPITNVMWGDTVALIKMAARPIELSVAQELSPTPRAVLEEQKKALSPSAAKGEGAVRDDDDDDDGDIMEVVDTITDDIIEVNEPERTGAVADDDEVVVASTKLPVMESVAEEDEESDGAEDEAPDSEEVGSGDDEEPGTKASDQIQTEEGDDNLGVQETLPASTETDAPAVSEEKTTEPEQVLAGDSSKPVQATVADNDDDDDSIKSVEEESKIPPAKARKEASVSDPKDAHQPSLRTEEDKMIGGDILFHRNSPKEYQGWDTLRWMAHNGARKVNSRQTVYRLKRSERRGLPLFWKQGRQYDHRALIIYDQPRLILVVRRPANLEEIQSLLGFDDVASTEEWSLNPETALKSYWILESVVDPSSSKLRLSSLTTSTSVANDDADDREKSCFHILTPVETISLSAVDVRNDVRREERSFSDSGAFLETLSLESVIAQTISAAHGKSGDLGSANTDITWKHQVIIGSLHALVISGNPTALSKGLEHARMISSDTRGLLPARVINATDDNGFTPLYYACSKKMSAAVRILVRYGADVNIGTETSTMAHICARNLDDQSLSAIFATPTRPDPNKLDKKGRTALYVAMVEGSVLDHGRDPNALSRCILALEAWGGVALPKTTSTSLRHPICALAYMWLPEYLGILLNHCVFRYPLIENGTVIESSVAALYQYPIHCALLAMRKLMQQKGDKSPNVSGGMLIKTLKVLLEHGFEPNERLDSRAFGTERTSLDEFTGLAPIQILALIALEFSTKAENLITTTELRGLLASIAEFLVNNGARLSVDPPMKDRLRHDKGLHDSGPRRVEVLTSKIDSDSQVLTLFGGNDRLAKARCAWAETKKVANLNTKCLDDEKNVTEGSEAAGGSDSLSCCICWSAFGTLMNRKHRCRVMNRFVCDDCSTKRLVQATTEIRLSDGQFNLARADSLREQAQRNTVIPKAHPQAPSRETMEQKYAAVRSDRLKAETSNRESLFGGIVESASNYVFGDQQDEQDQVNGLTATLGKTRDALNERGEKLDSLGEKSAQLVDASSDFAKMAKELRKQSEGGFFW